MTRITLWLVLGMFAVSTAYSQGTRRSGLIRNFEKEFPGELHIKWDKVSRGPYMIMGTDIHLNAGTVDSSNVDALSRHFIDQHEDLLNVRNTKLVLKKITPMRNRYIVSYQQTYEGIPLWNVKLRMKILQTGKILTIESPCYDSPAVNTTPKLTLGEARKKAAADFETDTANVYGSQLVIYPDRNTGILHLCWSLKVENATVHEGVMIDARSGNEVFRYDLRKDAQIYGTVSTESWSLPGEVNGSPDETVASQDLTVNVSGVGSVNTNSSGYYSITVPSSGNYTVTAALSGPHAFVENDYNYYVPDASYSATASTSSPQNWTWNNSSDYHAYFMFDYMNRAWHEYLADVAGFSSSYWDSNRMTGLAISGTLNGWANGTQIAVTQDEHYGDVVYHEYSHNVIYQANGYFLGDNAYGDGNAMDEGLADYFACSFTGDPHVYIGGGYDRDLSAKMKYYPPGPPDDAAHEAHTRGQIISGACWDLAHEPGMSLSYVDGLVYEAVSNMNYEGTFADFMDQILSADDNDGNIFNGTPHYSQIVDAFVNDHGVFPNVLVGANITSSCTVYNNLSVYGSVTVNGNLILENGATLTLEPGASIHFSSGGNLIADGKLISNGTASQPVSVTGGGIVIDGSGASGSTLAYLNMSGYSGTNIQVVSATGIHITHLTCTDNGSISFNNSTGTVDNSTLSNPYSSGDRILITNASTVSCYDNTIYDPGPVLGEAGVVYSEGSNGNFGQNSVSGIDYGMMVYDNSSPHFHNPYYGTVNRNNRFTQNGDAGIIIYNDSYPVVGYNGSDCMGVNSIYGNYGEDIWIYGETFSLDALGTYWNNGNPSDAKFILASGCSVDTGLPLSTDPWAGIPIPSSQHEANTPLLTSAATKGELGVTGKSHSDASTAPVVSGSSSDSLSGGFRLRDQGEFRRAENFFMSYLTGHPHDQRAYVELYDCADSETIPSLIGYFKALPKGASKLQEIFLPYLYLKKGSYTSANEVDDSIISQNPNTELSQLAGLNKFYIALYDQNNPQKASSILNAVVREEGALFVPPIMHSAKGGQAEPMEIQCAQNALATYVNPKTGEKFMASQANRAGSLDDINSNSGIPAEFGLSQNYPNPFNPTTVIDYGLPKDSHVTLKIYNVLGQVVETLVNADQQAGRYSVNFNGSGLASGVYLYRLVAGNHVITKKMLMLK